MPLTITGWLNLALIHAGLGNKDEAFAQLEEAYQEHAHALLYLNVDPRFDGLRSDPRFDELLKKIGFYSDSGVLSCRSGLFLLGSPARRKESRAS